MSKLIVTTGIPGCGRKDYLKRFEEYAARKGIGGGTPETAQKQVIWFRSGKSVIGEDFMHEIRFKGIDPKILSEAMSKANIPFQTIGSDRIFVFNKAGEFFDKGLANKLNLIKLKFRDKITNVIIKKGEGDFLGSWLEDDLFARKEALEIYKKNI